MPGVKKSQKVLASSSKSGKSQSTIQKSDISSKGSKGLPKRPQSAPTTRVVNGTIKRATSVTDVGTDVIQRIVGRSGSAVSATLRLAGDLLKLNTRGVKKDARDIISNGVHAVSNVAEGLKNMTLAIKNGKAPGKRSYKN